MLEKVEMTPGIQALWQEDILLDLSIEVEDQEFKVHKVVMAGLCDYFKAMFRVGMKDSEADRVRLDGFSALAVSNMISFIYTSQFGRKIATTEELLKLAVYLQFPRGIEVCEEYLCAETDPTDCLSILSIFKSFSLNGGIEYTVKYIKEHFDEVMEECSPDTLPLEDFVNLMDCWDRSEWELFELAKQWLEGEDRKQHIDEVMTRIRFPLMSPIEIASVKDMDIYSSSAGSWCELIDKALVYHSLPTHKKVMDDSDQTKVRSEPTPVCFPAEDEAISDYLCSQEEKWSWEKHESSKHGETEAFMMPELKRSWEWHSTFNGPEFGDNPVVAVAANNFLIVSEFLSKWYIFDPRTMTWSPMASLGTDTLFFALVYHEKYLYALGGALPGPPGDKWSSDLVSDIIQKYDFETDTWTIIPSKLPVPLQGHRALSIDGSIYVTAGRKTVRRGHKDFSTRMDSFDPSTDTWESKPPMTKTTRNLAIQLMKLRGKEVISVLDENLTLQYYTPSSNEWTDVWHGHRRPGLLHKLVKWNHSSSVVAKGRYLYLLNFFSSKGDEHACARMEFPERGGSEILEIGLDEFPIEEDWQGNEIMHFCALLSINHKYVKNGDEPAPVSVSEDSDSDLSGT